MASSGVLFERLHPSKRYKRYKSVTSGSRMRSGFWTCCYAERNKHNETPGKGVQKRFKQMFVTLFVTRPEAAWEAALRHSALQLFTLFVTLLVLNTTLVLSSIKYYSSIKSSIN